MSSLAINFLLTIADTISRFWPNAAINRETGLFCIQPVPRRGSGGYLLIGFTGFDGVDAIIKPSSSHLWMQGADGVPTIAMLRLCLVASEDMIEICKDNLDPTLDAAIEEAIARFMRDEGLGLVRRRTVEMSDWIVYDTIQREKNIKIRREADEFSDKIGYREIGEVFWNLFNEALIGYCKDVDGVVDVIAAALRVADERGVKDQLIQRLKDKEIE